MDQIGIKCNSIYMSRASHTNRVSQWVNKLSLASKLTRVIHLTSVTLELLCESSNSHLTHFIYLFTLYVSITVIWMAIQKLVFISVERYIILTTFINSSSHIHKSVDDNLIHVIYKVNLFCKLQLSVNIKWSKTGVYCLRNSLIIRTNL